MVSRRRVRLRDIADVAGVTPSTVSRVLNQAPESARIPQATRQRVEKIAADLHYVPDPSARGLRTGRGFLVPLLVPDLTGAMVGALYRSVAGPLAAAGLNVIMGEADTLGTAALRELSLGSLAGLIVVGDIELSIDLPTVRVAPTPDQRHAATGPVIRIDHASGAIGVADHLLGLGHRRLAMISFAGQADVAEREVFVRTARDHGAEVVVVPAASLAVEAGRAAMAELMGRADPPTAVLAATDTLAVGALLWCLESAVAVPDQVSLVGYDDIPLATSVQPALTTVRQPIEAMGAAAAVALTRLLDADPGAEVEPDPVIMLPTELVVRASTAPPHP